MATDATARIKNLSIALRELSKGRYKNFGDRVFAMLGHEIAKAEEEIFKEEYQARETVQPVKSAPILDKDDPIF